MHDGTVFGLSLDRAGIIFALASVGFVMAASIASSLGLMIASLPLAIVATGLRLKRHRELTR